MRSAMCGNASLSGGRGVAERNVGTVGRRSKGLYLMQARYARANLDAAHDAPTFCICVASRSLRECGDACM